MRSEERQSRIKQIEHTIAKLQKKGWRMEVVEHTDEDGEPFRTVIRMSCTPRPKYRRVI